MSRYGIQWLPQGAIPRDLGLQLTLQPVQAPSSSGGPAVCVPKLAALQILGSGFSLDPVDSTIANVDCVNGWTATITAFIVPCPGQTGEFTVVSSYPTGTPPSYVTGTSPEGMPTITFTGDPGTCPDVGQQGVTIATIHVGGIALDSVQFFAQQCTPDCGSGWLTPDGTTFSKFDSPATLSIFPAGDMTLCTTVAADVSWSSTQTGTGLNPSWSLIVDALGTTVAEGWRVRSFDPGGDQCAGGTMQFTLEATVNGVTLPCTVVFDVTDCP